MDFYTRLKNYFPEEELKKYAHLRDLLNNQDTYYKAENEDYLLLYSEFDTFIFVDYLLVSGKTRGKGVGTQVLDKLKDTGKAIILEVEPPTSSVPDSEKRIRFYEKNGFQLADQIHYNLETEDGEALELDIYYWSPTPLTQEEVMEKMATACDEVHNFRSMLHYGKIRANPEEVLELKEPVTH
ncbi:Acetyltransferase (GNAT) domain-containing protein [Marininema mesophilum]|uniref:Acetyltransferase (GNAT) domain-containing protein n=1 Tax=Marininema mesophilum TaxID=1048340 RepID=A0A1H3A1H5_9BACL|nr:GNAT family N-acetyltransferase [Marininema mesophilum]SDX23632.1 Acetyltransferase (GNAT) domain-containing protein [Marininema mesophilum]